MHGPSWLSEESYIWPTWNFPEIDLEREYKETNEEAKAVVFEIEGILKENYEILQPIYVDELRSSSPIKLLNITGYVQRFVEKIKKKQSSLGNLKQDETQKAEKL